MRIQLDHQFLIKNEYNVTHQNDVTIPITGILIKRIEHVNTPPPDMPGMLIEFI